MKLQKTGEQDDTSASINHVIHRIHPGREKLKPPALILVVSPFLCSDISYAMNSAEENIIRVIRETSQSARRRLAGIDQKDQKDQSKNYSSASPL